jgi:hypothetical protein
MPSNGYIFWVSQLVFSLRCYSTRIILGVALSLTLFDRPRPPSEKEEVLCPQRERLQRDTFLFLPMRKSRCRAATEGDTDRKEIAWTYFKKLAENEYRDVLEFYVWMWHRIKLTFPTFPQDILAWCCHFSHCTSQSSGDYSPDILARCCHFSYCMSVILK